MPWSVSGSKPAIKLKLVNRRVMVPVALVAVGLVGLLATHAATPTASLEPEAGIASANTQFMSGANASGTGYVKFSNATKDCSTSLQPPSDMYIKLDVSNAPLDANSDTYIQSILSYERTEAGYDSGVLHILSGRTPSVYPYPKSSYRYPAFPVNLIDKNHSLVNYALGAYNYLSDAGSYPDPTYLNYQGKVSDNQPIYDQYMLSVTSDCKTYETIGTGALFGTPIASAAGEVTWDNSYTPHKSNYIDPVFGVTNNPSGTTASGMPLTPEVIRASEVASGAVNHVMHFYSLSCRGGSQFIWPARRSDCKTAIDAAQAPYGAWMRLKSNYPTPTDHDAAVVVAALKKYGMIVGDGGVQGVAAEDLSSTTTDQLEQIGLAQFEFVNTDSLRANNITDVNNPNYWKIK